MLYVGALILTLILVFVLTYRPAPIGSPPVEHNWRRAAAPGAIFFVGNALILATQAAGAEAIATVLMLVGIVGLIRNRRSSRA